MGTTPKNRFANQSYMNWDVTLEIARGKLGDSEPLDIAQRAAVRYDAAAGEFVIPYLNQEHRVRYPSGEVYLPRGGEVPIVNKILILHYLEHAEGVPLHHKWISFKEIPGGQIYINPFYNRAIRPLIKLFGRDPQGLITAGLALGGKKENLGDACVAVPVFPMVPVAYVIWEGDEEFDPSGNILFDESAPHYLPLEDYAVIAGSAVFELRKQLDQPAYQQSS
ncbi:MAG: DUF3786 domain-containing protein [Thermacetogeniaceae bacterium]